MIFKDEELLLIREFLAQQVNEELKKIRKYSEKSIKILPVIKKIDFFMRIK